MNDINHNVVVEELIRLFESDLGEFPILHTAIRCLNQQAQEIDTFRAMLKTLEENYTQLAEFSANKIDANYNLRVLHSAMIDGIKVLYKELIAETDALDMKIYVDLIYKRVMDKYSDGIGGIINYEAVDR